MAENTTSVLRKDPAEDITLEDVLYLIQGVGANRDRKMTLEQLRDFLFEYTNMVANLLVKKMHVYDDAVFEKDVDIDADLTVEKSISLDGQMATLSNKQGQTNLKSLHFQQAQRDEINDSLTYCSNLTLDQGRYTMPTVGIAASNLGLFKIIANDTDSNVQVYYRNAYSVTLAPGQAATFIWGGGTYGWFSI